MTGKVYFVSAPGRIKVGYTRQPERRLRSLQQVDMESLTPIAVIDGTRATETKIHEVLRAHWIRGEWFNDCPEVRSVIADAVAGKYAPEPEPERELPAEIVQVAGNPSAIVRPELVPACIKLGDDLMQAIQNKEDKFAIRARARALISVTELMLERSLSAAPEIVGEG